MKIISQSTFPLRCLTLGFLMILGCSDSVPPHTKNITKQTDGQLLDSTKSIPETSPLKLAPLEMVMKFTTKQKISLNEYHQEQPAINRYCPPQPTVYDWNVQFQHKKDPSKYLIFAVTDQRENLPSQVWQLDMQYKKIE